MTPSEFKQLLEVTLDSEYKEVFCEESDNPFCYRGYIVDPESKKFYYAFIPIEKHYKSAARNFADRYYLYLKEKGLTK